jgi:hypothetical protein
MFCQDDEEDYYAFTYGKEENSTQWTVGDYLSYQKKQAELLKKDAPFNEKVNLRVRVENLRLAGVDPNQTLFFELIEFTVKKELAAKFYAYVEHFLTNIQYLREHPLLADAMRFTCQRIVDKAEMSVAHVSCRLMLGILPTSFTGTECINDEL